MNIVKHTNSKLVSTLFVAFIATSLFMLQACKDDDPIDVTSPGYLIEQSEKITIPSEVDLPTNTAGYERVATFYAEGVQIYNAQLKSGTTNTYEWVFASPSATLYNDKNEQIGTHFSGPTWQVGNDFVNGQAFTPAKSKNVDPNSIDWLLLMPKNGTTPSGIFAGVTHIQRIVTVGGRAPSEAPTNASATRGVTYTTVYRFSKAK